MIKSAVQLKEISEVFHKDGVALRGYDVVAYFKDNMAIRGDKNYSFTWSGLKWYFSSADHLSLFEEFPDKFLPEYGGYCAFGAANGYKAKPKMSTFLIHRGKLYLNFAQYVKKRWIESLESKIQAADKQWSATKKTVPIKANRIFIYFKYKWLKVFGKDLFNLDHALGIVMKA